MCLELPDGDLKISAGRVGGHITLQTFTMHNTTRYISLFEKYYSFEMICSGGLDRLYVKMGGRVQEKNWPSMAYTTGKPRMCREPDTTGQGRNPVGKGFAVNGSRQNPHGKQFLAESH
jgi:hypothetical protein